MASLNKCFILRETKFKFFDTSYSTNLVAYPYI